VNGLYYRQLRDTIRTVLAPELTSAQARDAAAIIDRILAEFIVEDEAGPTLRAKFAASDGERTEGAALVRQQDPRAPDVLEAELAFLEAWDAARVAVLTEAIDTTETAAVNLRQVTSILQRHVPGAVVETIEVVPGGRSKDTLLVTLAPTDALPTQVILRLDRPVGLLQTRAADEFEIIKAIHEYGGVPIPQPYLAGHDGDITYEVLERVRGHKAGEYFPDLAAPTHHQREIGAQIARSLGRLHAMPLDLLSATPLTKPEETGASVSHMVEAIVARIDQLSGPPCASVYAAHRWLLDHVGDAVPAPRAGLVQGDFGLHNMLIDGDRLTALVDWEAAAIASPSRELAAAWNPITALMPWTEFLAAYTVAGGNEDDADPRRVNFYRVFGALGAFMTSRTGGHMFRTGAKRDLLTAHSGLDSHFRCARNLARVLNEVS
jgi:aminoglycoside phosphotransferase (APT) family kinase protein